MTNEEILAKLDIDKAIAEVIKLGPMWESETIALATLSSRSKRKGVLQLQFTRERSVLRDFEYEVNPEYEKKVEANPVDAAIADLRFVVGVLDRDICEKWSERELAQRYAPTLLMAIRKLLEAYDGAN